MKPFRGTLIIISVLGSVLIQDPSCLRVPESLSTGLVDPEHSSWSQQGEKAVNPKWPSSPYFHSVWYKVLVDRAPPTVRWMNHSVQSFRTRQWDSPSGCSSWCTSNNPSVFEGIPAIFSNIWGETISPHCQYAAPRSGPLWCGHLKYLKLPCDHFSLAGCRRNSSRSGSLLPSDVPFHCFVINSDDGVEIKSGYTVLLWIWMR